MPPNLDWRLPPPTSSTAGAGSLVPGPRAKPPARWHVGAAAAAFVLVSAALTWPLARHPASTMAAPFGDPLLNTWILAWGAERLLHGLQGFWTGLFFYPYPDTLAYSEHLLGITLFTAPIQWLTGNAVLVLNLAIIGSGALAGLGAWLLAREVCEREDVAWVAGLAFAAAPYRAAHITHLQVLASGWIPISLWCLTRYVRTRDRKWLAAWAVSFLLNALSNGYFLYFAAVPTAMLVAHALWRERGAARRLLSDLAMASVGVLLGLAPVAAAYLRVRREQGLTRSLGDASQFSAHLVSYTHADARLWLWGGVLPDGRGAELQLFPGFLVLILACAVLLATRATRDGSVPGPARDERLRAQTWLYVAIAATAVLLTLGPSPAVFGSRVVGPYAWLRVVVPGMDGLRVPARMATIVSLALAVLAALAVERMTRRFASRARVVVVIGTAIVIVAEGMPRPLSVERFPTPDMGADRAAYEWLRQQSGGPMLELPIGDLKTSVRHLYRTLQHQHRIVNGYSGYGSALQAFLRTPFDELDHIGEALVAVRALGLRWIAVHPALYGDPREGDMLIRALRDAHDDVVRVEYFGSTAIAELRPLQPSLSSNDPAWRQISWRHFTAVASNHPERLALAFDGDRRSRWFTGDRQRGDEWVELRFSATRDAARVRLESDRWTRSDYPRGLTITSVDDNGVTRTLFAGGIVDRLALSIVNEPQSPGIDVVLPPNQTRVLRLSTMGQTQKWYWSIGELRVFER